MKFTQFATPALALFVGSVAATQAADSCDTDPPQPSKKPHLPPKGGQVVHDVDVAIIGGGSAGIHAAVQLKDAGAKVIVIEKKKQIGGHAETYYAPNGPPVNVGVALFVNSSVVTDYFERLKVKTMFVNPATSPGTPASLNFDFSLGVPIPPQNASAAQAQQQAVAAAAQSYTKNILAKYSWIDSGFHVPTPVPAELLMPFGELAKKYQFEALLPIIATYNFYTGDISKRTALFGIKDMGPELLNSFFGNFVVPASGDTRSLYKAAEKELEDSILLESTIVKVTRTAKTGKPVVILVSQPGEPTKLIRAKKLIIAVPQIMSNIRHFDISGDEEKLFSRFIATGYWAGITTVPGLTNSVRNVGVATPYNQPVIPGTSAIQATTAPGYFQSLVGFDNLEYTDASAKAVVLKNLATLSAVGGVPAGSAEEAKFVYSSDHGPFNLHVSTEDIKNEFYRKLLKRQGERNTYFTGAALAGHNSGLIWNYNMKTVVPGLKKDIGL